MNNKKNNLEKSRQQQTIIQQQQTEIYSGPIPSPETLEKYSELNPDAPKIIFDIYIKQSNHRMEMEKKALDADIKHTKLGLIIGAIVITLVILTGSFLIYSNKRIEGIGIVITAITSVTMAFINSKTK